jgi:hypothetical protein
VLALLCEVCVPLAFFEKCEHETVRASSTAAAAVPNTFAIIAFAPLVRTACRAARLVPYLGENPRMMKALLYGLLWFACSAAAQVDPAIVGKLREGGLVLYMRHTSTDFSQNDAAMTSYEDCAHQRNLTDKGRAEAREIGAHFKRLGIPLGEVLASPFCRTLETARLAFDELKKLLATPVKQGENRVIASHGNPFHAVAGPPYLAEGEIAVVRPEGGMRFTVIARIRPQDWSGLRAGGGRASWAGP